MRIEALEKLATELIGDGQRPNMFFVSVEGEIKLVTTEYEVAREYRYYLPRNIETAIEDRLVGVLASTEPVEDGSKLLHTIDNSYMLEGL